jgi:hypothetical protein
VSLLDTLGGAVCALCGETLTCDGPMGWVHANRSMYGADGHAVSPITRAAFEARARRE